MALGVIGVVEIGIFPVFEHNFEYIHERVTWTSNIFQLILTLKHLQNGD
jgi:hypothetical protein